MISDPYVMNYILPHTSNCLEVMSEQSFGKIASPEEN